MRIQPIQFSAQKLLNNPEIAKVFDKHVDEYFSSPDPSTLFGPTYNGLMIDFTDGSDEERVGSGLWDCSLSYNEELNQLIIDGAESSNGYGYRVKVFINSDNKIADLQIDGESSTEFSEFKKNLLNCKLNSFYVEPESYLSYLRILNALKEVVDFDLMMKIAIYS